MSIPNVLRWSALIALVMLAPLGCGSDSKSPTDPGDNEPPKATSISLSANTLAFAALRDSSQLTATVKDQRGNTMAEASISWASTDTAVAKVNASGWVVAVANGTADIVATSGTLTDTAKVTVAQGAAVLELSVDTASFDALGDSIQLAVTIQDENGHDIDPAVVEWASTDTTVVSVSEDGWLTSRGNGTASVIASAGEAADTVEVEVEQVAVAVVITPDSAVVGEGDTLRIEAVVTDANGHPIDGETITWSSAAPGTADVDDAGLLTGKWRGNSTTVTAKSGELSETIPVRVADQIVFANAAGEIYRINDDGSGERLLVQTGGRAPVWSPDGNKIAYEVVSGTESDIWVMNADGSGKQQLTTSGKAGSPAWSPNSEKIAYTDQPGAASVGTVYVMNADGTGKTKLTENILTGESEPTWSPTGTRIAYLSVYLLASREVVVINADGTGLKRLTDNSARESHLTWSPDGGKLAYQSDLSGKNRLYVYDIGAGTTEELLDFSSDYNWSFPQWSPVENKVLFQTDRYGDLQVAALDLDSGTPFWNAYHVGTPSRFAKWAPDGKRVLYRVGDGDLYVASSTMSNPVRITRKADGGDAAQHDWRPRPLIFIPPIFP